MQGVWPEVEKGLAKVGVETISIWSDPSDDCALYMCFGQEGFRVNQDSMVETCVEFVCGS